MCVYVYIRILPFDISSLSRRSVAPCPVTALIPTPGCLARDSAGPGIASLDWRAQLRSVISHRRMGDAHATGRARTCRFVRNVSVVGACDRRRVLWSLRSRECAPPGCSRSRQASRGVVSRRGWSGFGWRRPAMPCATRGSSRRCAITVSAFVLIPRASMRACVRRVRARAYREQCHRAACPRAARERRRSRVFSTAAVAAHRESRKCEPTMLRAVPLSCLGCEQRLPARHSSKRRRRGAWRSRLETPHHVIRFRLSFNEQEEETARGKLFAAVSRNSPKRPLR